MEKKGEPLGDPMSTVVVEKADLMILRLERRKMKMARL